MPDEVVIGVDFGGTKIEAAALDPGGAYLARIRVPTPANYEDAVAAVVALVERVEAQVGPASRFGIGIPGSVSPRTGLIRNANATFLNQRPFRSDLEQASGKAVALANDANCLALSEAIDGAAASAQIVFAAVLGTGCGAGIAVHGRVLEGANGIAGEWGHNPLPGFSPELPSRACWCGKSNCVERWISGSGLTESYRASSGMHASGEQVVAAMRAGDVLANALFEQFLDQLARSLAIIVNTIDPEVIVLGGGMANIGELYTRLPSLVGAHVFADHWSATLAPSKWGDSSGVRGAAWLGRDLANAR